MPLGKGSEGRGWLPSFPRRLHLRPTDPENGFLRFVAGCTCVQKIRVFALAVRLHTGGHEVLYVERPPAAIPQFTMKAVHAAKSKLVAQPISIAAVVLVARGAMPPGVWRGWILISDHRALLPFVCEPENNRFSSSSSAWVGRGATLSMR